MSCSRGNCGCGSGCKCGNSCGGCKMYPDLGVSGETTTTETFAFGVAPRMKNQYDASGESSAENDACRCGSDYKCDLDFMISVSVYFQVLEIVVILDFMICGLLSSNWLVFFDKNDLLSFDLML
ncbi:unnamed protein product [Thlaspi arvense]|uniref:Metallothionein-like protein n=1 Tax=Thlaspi arvense TaxID=13288 RepID=A0AAU9TAB7_THLAR|nr:unnamed protein product [Thlaspi arvense]